jgi:hypothetical protein
MINLKRIDWGQVLLNVVIVLVAIFIAKKFGMFDLDPISLDQDYEDYLDYLASSPDGQSLLPPSDLND